jgi:ketosteroid isomerase-like protein
MTETESNRAMVRRAFDQWAAGEKSFFDLLADDVRWTIAGSGRSARTYRGREAFLSEAFAPVAERFAAPIQPVLAGLHADGNVVVLHWNGKAALRDGQTYRNSYVWILELRDGKIVKGTAFLDLRMYEAAVDGVPLPAWPSEEGA